MIPIGLLLKAKGFFVKYGIRMLLISGLAGALFVGGCQYANVQHAEHTADLERAKVVAIAARTAELNAEWLVKLETEETARAALQFDFSIIQEHRDSLIEGIREAQLTKPANQVTIEACLETEDENIKLVVANPFTADFTRLWNDASRTVRTGEAANPETD